MSEHIITREVKGHVALVGLNRVAERNAFDRALIGGLSLALDASETDDAVRATVLFAHGDHFTAGLDLADVAPAVASGAVFPEGALDFFGLHGRARTKPLVMAVQGRCLTIGIELALAADITVAADDVRFAQIEIKRGIFPFGGATTRLVQTAGWGNAMRWLLTGDEFGAAEAYRIGLVQEVTPRGQELARATAIAETIARQAPLAVRATLEAARRALNEGPEAAARAFMPRILDLMKTDDAREGLQSFLERRDGRFTGK